jgi:hypothetical protein
VDGTETEREREREREGERERDSNGSFFVLSLSFFSSVSCGRQFPLSDGNALFHCPLLKKGRETKESGHCFAPLFDPFLLSLPLSLFSLPSAPMSVLKAKRASEM